MSMILIKASVFILPAYFIFYHSTNKKTHHEGAYFAKMLFFRNKLDEGSLKFLKQRPDIDHHE